MGFLIIIPFAALAGWSILTVYRWLRDGKYERQWWQAFYILGAVGLAVGIFFAFFSHYTVAKIRLEGFPIPVSITNPPTADSPAAQSAMPLAIRLGGWITDLLSGVAMCIGPLAIVAFFRENKGKLMPERDGPS